MGASWPEWSAQAGPWPVGQVSTLRLRLRLQVRVAQAEEVFEVDGASWKDRETACEALGVSIGRDPLRPGPVLSVLRGASRPQMAAKAPEFTPTLAAERTSEAGRRSLTQGLAPIAWAIPPQRGSLGNGVF